MHNYSENKDKEVNFHISKKRKIYNETIKLENEESIFEVENKTGKVISLEPINIE